MKPQLTRIAKPISVRQSGLPPPHRDLPTVEYLGSSSYLLTPSADWIATYERLIGDLEEVIFAWIALEPPDEMNEYHDLQLQSLGAQLALFKADLIGDFDSAIAYGELGLALDTAAAAAFDVGIEAALVQMGLPTSFADGTFLVGLHRPCR